MCLAFTFPTPCSAGLCRTLVGLLSPILKYSNRGGMIENKGIEVISHFTRLRGEIQRPDGISVEAMRPFVRSLENGRQTDPQYLMNQIDGLVTVFGPWFNSKSQEDFIEMLRKQHLVVTTGDDGHHPYRVFLTPDHVNYMSNDPDLVVPGVFIFEEDSDLSALDQLDKMEHLVRQIRDNKCKTKDQRLNLLRLLAEYHYVSMNPFLFYQVNHSLIMAQINYMLVYHGLREIVHGELDSLLRKRGNVDTFLRAVLDANPNFLAP